MESQDKLNLGITIVCAIIAISLILTACICSYETKKLWIENNYEQVMTVGSGNYRWQKVKQDK